MSNDLDHFITLSKQLSKGLLLNLHENPFSNNQKSRNILDTNNVETEHQVSLRNQCNNKCNINLVETKQINIFKKKRFTLGKIAFYFQFSLKLFYYKILFWFK